MTLSELCINFDQAKKLKQLGVDEDSYFIYFLDSNKIILSHHDSGVELFGRVIRYPAYTSAELGELIKNNTSHIEQFWSNQAFEFLYDDENKWANNFISKGKTEAQARAEFLIYLLENK
ncbi:MAG TPA: hypothetical protein VIJ14_05155 [Rhabdochlamydiaceae bacterium]